MKLYRERVGEKEGVILTQQGSAKYFFRKTEKIHRKRNPLFRRTPRHIKIGVLRNFSFVFHPPFLYTVYIPLIPRTPSFPPLIPLLLYFYSEFIYFFLYLSLTQLLFPKELSSFYSLYYISRLFIFIISFLIDEWALCYLMFHQQNKCKLICF